MPLGSISPLPEGFTVETTPEGLFLNAGRETLARLKSSVFQAPGLVRYMALRKDWVWSYPAHGTALPELPAEVQLLLWERRDGKHCLLMPLVDGDLRASLEGADGGMRLCWGGQLPGAEPESATLAVLALGDEPLALVQNTMKLVAERLRTFRLRDEKRVPAFVDQLGWCTWDAFYREVDEAKALAGLASFAAGGVHPGFMMLDDGWQDVNDKEQLLSFGVNRTKFPSGLPELVRKAKADYGVKLFGVWHAFEGYWRGLDPQGPLGDKYPLVKTRKVSPPPAGQTEEVVTELNLPAPLAASRFYNDYHAELRRAGVDMVKVDNQSGLDAFTDGHLGRVSSMRLYQEALQGSTQNYFLGNCVSCMSNGSDVVFNMMSANVIRNSNDYFPKRDVKAQQTHVFNNAMNAVWFSTVAIPDWDMFQTHGICPEFHAAARALSGGPVYVCDKPGQHDFGLLAKLTVSGSRALRLDGPALPLPECVYVDSLREPSALKLVNRRGPVAVLGLFNCQHDGAALKTSFSPADIAFLKGRSFAAYFHRTGKLETLGAKARREVELEATGWELITLAPLDSGLAPLGLADKYAGAAALQNWGWLDKDHFDCALVDGGRAVFHSKRAPTAVTCDSRKAKFSHDAKSGLLSVKAPEGALVKIRIAFGD